MLRHALFDKAIDQFTDRMLASCRESFIATISNGSLSILNPFFRLSLGAKRLTLRRMATQSNFSVMHDASIPFSYLADRSHITSKIKYSTLAQVAKNQNSGLHIRCFLQTNHLHTMV